MANLLVEAIDRAERRARVANLLDLRYAFGADPKKFAALVRDLSR